MNYAEIVKPETFSVSNLVELTWEKTSSAAWNPEETLTGTIKWDFSGLRHEGPIKTAEGGPIPAKESNKTIEFRLYDNPTGGTLLWGRAYAVHLDTNGLFNVELSDTTGSPAQGAYTNDLAWVLSEKAGESSSLYIALFVNGSSGEIRPRQKLLNVPTAMSPSRAIRWRPKTA